MRGAARLTDECEPGRLLAAKRTRPTDAKPQKTPSSHLLARAAVLLDDKGSGGSRKQPERALGRLLAGVERPHQALPPPRDVLVPVKSKGFVACARCQRTQAIDACVCVCRALSLSSLSCWSREQQEPTELRCNAMPHARTRCAQPPPPTPCLRASSAAAPAPLAAKRGALLPSQRAARGSRVFLCRKLCVC